MNWNEKLESVIWLMVLVALLGAYFGWSDKVVSSLMKWLSSLAVGVVMSGVAGSLVEAFSGDFLKSILVPVSVGPFEFSVSLFAIATLVMRFLIF